MKKLRLFVIQLFVLPALFVGGAFADTLSLDTTFNGTGYNIQPVAPSPVTAFSKSMALQADGKIVVAGYTVTNQSPEEFALMRFNANGTLDTSFGMNGVVKTRVGIQDFEGKVLIQPDGKILLGGNATTNGASTEFALVRYNADGSLDTSFNSTGSVIYGAPGLAFDDFHDMILQSDGKIIVAGRTAQIPGTPNLEYNAIMIRVNANGSLDTSFNGSGILITGETGVEEALYSVITQPDGKILVGGYRLTSNSYQYTVTRLNSNGSPDTSFGTGGTVAGRFSSSVSNISTMVLQSDGKILAGGWDYITRITTNGTIDRFFGVNGVISAPTYEGRIKILGDDRFLVTGRFAVNVARYLKDGEPDLNFSGFMTIPGYTCSIPSIDIQSDGKIVLGGACSDSLSKFAAFRLRENVSYVKRHLDFDGDRISNISLFRPSSGQWLYLNSTFSQTTVAQFGISTDRLVPADFTGDGRTDIAIFRPSTGEWFVLRASNGTYFSFPFGTAGDLPLAGDFDGDQIADAGVFRPSTNQWFIQKSTGGLIITTFGTAGDKLVPSDYDGDNKADIAIYRPSTGEWWIQRSSDGGVYAFQFGASSDSPVQGDYTGDGKTDAAFWRPSTGEWFILRSEDGSYYSIPFGTNGDLPSPGHYGGDGKFDLVVFRPSTNEWHIQLTGGAYSRVVFGITGDQPVANVFVP